MSFAIWITGLPACGKSTLASALLDQLAARGVRAARLESDALRTVLTPRPAYTEEEREFFYGVLTWMAGLLTDHGVPVVLDATANRRAYRAAARRRLARFLEVWVDTPLETCRARDPKGIYRTGGAVPGQGAPYEPPESAEVVVRGGVEAPADAAARVVAALVERGWLDRGPADEAPVN